FFGILGSGVVAFKYIEKSLPKGVERTEKLIRIQHKLNSKALEIMGLQKTDKAPAFIYQYLHEEVDTVMTTLNGFMTPSQEQVQALVQQRGNLNDPASLYLLEMVEANQSRTKWTANSETKSSIELTVPKVDFSKLATWLLFPILFFFFMIDDGSALRFAVKLIPNSYFELSLTAIEKVDKALGHYLRGTALECASVGSVIGVGLFLFGFDYKSAIVIGAIAGITNAIPFLGPLVGLIVGLGYGLTIDKVDPILPFVTTDNLPLGVLISVGLAQLLDNAFFQPVLVGRAVNLHPVIVILAVSLGGAAFGFAGILLSIPVVVASKVCVETIYAGLNDYRLI
ncbi:MAG: AI-2E family transporter, partial [Bdellovibrionales bacterium]|nr:AI-2E family transporter [Bdellovibrionales bacterium]